MFTIHLNKLSFFAHHGMHGEEAIIGTGFEVDVAVQIDDTGKITEIHQTINYTAIYDIIKIHLFKPVPLLETLAQNITEDIHLLDNRIRSINIHINKKHPPVRNFIGSVGVSYSKVF